MTTRCGGGNRPALGSCVMVLLLAAAWLAGPGLARANDAAVNVVVQAQQPDRVVLQYNLGSFDVKPVIIDGREYTQLVLGDESPIVVAGAPELPNICRSIVIPDDAEMAVRVLAERMVEYTDVDIVPSKGHILRTVNPASVPYTFGEAYETDAFYPGSVASLREPYVMRDVRGVVVELNPFQYNPVTRTLRVYEEVTLEVSAVGPGKVNVLTHRPAELSQAFNQIYARHFLNYAMPQRYVPLDETGDLLIIAYDSWITNLDPLVAHKNAQGINTTVVGVSTIGNTSTAIKSYIQNVYDTSDLAFVLLVGDSAQVATPSASGGASDPSYSKLAGSDDYPDIMVGRFSAENAGHVDTQVERTVEYEQMGVRNTDWFWRGMGVASNQGPGDDGEYDDEHMDNIRADLLAYGYTTVDQIYDPSGTASQVTSGLNAGRGIINYCGHGSTTSWSSTGFSNTHINALTNDNMLPFICSVACVNGNFDGSTCFAEAWLRATNNGEPTGAIGAYMSSINQSWNPPMDAEDEFVDMYVAEAYARLGTLFYAGSCHMMDEYGSGGVSMFDTWHVFGDPSLAVVNIGPMPPTAQAAFYSVEWNTPVDVDLQASDDGLPDPPGMLAYRVTTLPSKGVLKDAVTGTTITAVPYTLPNGGYQLVYEPYTNAFGTDNFAWLADDGGVAPEGGESNLAVIAIEMTLPDTEKIEEFTLDSDPGWTMEGGWAFGVPTGMGSHLGDPTAGYTGNYVLGYNLDGDYANGMTQTMYLTTPAMDFSGRFATELRFRRWLGVERNLFDHATVEISNDGVNWTLVWHNGSLSMSENSWSNCAYDISAVADDQPTVYIRWGMGPTDGSQSYPGWNLDDIEIWATFSLQPTQIVDSVPASGTIDARQPIDPNTMQAQGWTSVDLTFNHDADGIDPGKFSVEEVCVAGECDGVPPSLLDIATAGTTVTATFDRPIDPAAWTVIHYVDGDMDSAVWLGFLPGDADGSATANSFDVLAVIDLINDALSGGNPPAHTCDIDRSGSVSLTDMLVLVDLLNGSAPFDAYLGVSLPDLP